jgi:hypothetical protein
VIGVIVVVVVTVIVRSCRSEIDGSLKGPTGVILVIDIIVVPDVF